MVDRRRWPASSTRRRPGRPRRHRSTVGPYAPWLSAAGLLDRRRATASHVGARRLPAARLRGMPDLRAPRGTRDLLPAERAVLGRLEATARDLAARYGYREIETPLFEHLAVFERGIGEVTDVVEKELF